MLNESSLLATMTPFYENTVDRSLLLVDDEHVSRSHLARILQRKGFEVREADSVSAGIESAHQNPPSFAIVELRLNDGSGLDVLSAIRKSRPNAKIVILTAYGNIATAVAAIKAGAVDYLPKPVDPEAVENALLSKERVLPAPPKDPMSADRVRWEHIQRLYHQYGCNVSETARRLQMHRRTLQRILSKHAPIDKRREVISGLHTMTAGLTERVSISS